MTLRRTINITRILLIDDDPLARNILRQILELDGHMVVDAANGAVAMQRWSEQPADLIVTDILMPEKDGLEVIRELRRQCPQLKVIAVSGGNRKIGFDALDVASRFGATATLEKPFQLDTFRSTIEHVLKG